jgi:hypothetical protein
MAMTILTTMTWQSHEDQVSPMIYTDRETYLSQAVASGLTDGSVEFISPSISARPWLDQPAADNWATFIVNTATQYGITPPTVVFSNI